MTMRIKYIFLLLATFVFSLSHAQEQKRLTLQEAISLAVANSKQLKLADADLQAAQARVAQARDRAWPEVKASATYLRINTPNVSFKGADDGGGTGGSGGLASAFGNLHDIGLAQVTLSQPIFAGFKIRNNKVMAQYLAEAAQYEANTAKSKVVVNTTKAIFQYFELLETKKVIDQHIRQSEQRVAEFKNLEAQGLLARNDRLKAELQTNNIKLTKTEIDNNVELAQFNLSILLGLPESTVVTLDTTGMFTNTATASWDTYLQKAANRNEFKSAELQFHAAEAGTKVAKAARYPTLGLSAGYVDAYLPNVLTVTNALNGGLALQYNLTGIFHSKHLMQEAKARELRAATYQQVVQDEVRSEIKQKFLGYQQAIEKIAISEQAIEQAKENQSITKNKFDAGLVIFSDYLDADVLLLQAQINLTTARAEKMISYYELEEATGNIK